ncbi:MAG: VOC family protein [Bacteroidota bacterium]
MILRIKFLKLCLFLVLIFPLELYAQEVYIDHVIVAVCNLEKAINSMTSEGFTHKKGKLHDNGLLNAHIKFNNGTELEYMSVQKVTDDPLAITYQNFLKKGPGGAFLALGGIPIDSLALKLKATNIKYNVITSNLWSYLTFPDTSALAHLFFIEYHFDHTKEEVKYTTHTNGAQSIRKVWMEGNDSVNQLFEWLKMPITSSSQSKNVYTTPTGKIAVIRKKVHDHRPRIKSISFIVPDKAGNIVLNFNSL